jgi:hypothetical protein
LLFKVYSFPNQKDKLDKKYFSFSLGASKSIEECQYQFQDRHWNCSTVRDGTVFGPVLSHGK